MDSLFEGCTPWAVFTLHYTYKQLVLPITSKVLDFFAFFYLLLFEQQLDCLLFKWPNYALVCFLSSLPIAFHLYTLLLGVNLWGWPYCFSIMSPWNSLNTNTWRVSIISVPLVFKVFLRQGSKAAQFAQQSINYLSLRHKSKFWQKWSSISL